MNDDSFIDLTQKIMKLFLKYLKPLMIPSLLLVLLLIAQPCYGNPIAVDSGYNCQPIGALWILLWIISPFIEAVIITLWLRSRFTSVIAVVKLFLGIVILNLLTIPITQLLGTFLFHNVMHYSVYLAEIFPVVVEFLVLLWLFKSQIRHGNINGPVTAKQAFVLSLLANFITFLIGFGFYRFFPAPCTTF
jgi:hypothetical protein